MILYAVHCKGEITNNEWSIISIHKTEESAVNNLNTIVDRWKESKQESPDFEIITINTDSADDCIYNYDEFE